MSPQHEFVIDNGTGSAVRADLNNLFKAILTNNSGTTDPSTVISSDAGSKAFSFWADTNSSPAVLKIRNAADDGWIELFQLDGTLTLEDGSASTPALAFRDDLNTGIFQNANDSLNIGTGGAERVEFNSTEVVFNDPANDVDFRIEGDTEANLFFVNAGTNRVGVGTNAPSATFDVVGDIEATIADNAAYQEGLNITNGVNADFNVNIKSNATSIGPSTNTPFSFHVSGHANEKLRIDTNGKLSTGGETAPDVDSGGLCLNTGANDGIFFSCKNSDINHGRTSLDETDTLFSLSKVSGNNGGVNIRAYTDSASADPAIRMFGVIDDGSNASYCPVELRGARKNSGGNTGTSQMHANRGVVRISNDGDVTVATFTGQGLCFGTDIETQNALSDYEEGTFTPTFNASISSTAGSYTKIGRQVTVHIRVVFSSQSGSSQMIMDNLPFAASMPSGVSNGAMAGGFGYISTGTVIPQIHNTHNSTTVAFYNFNNPMTYGNVGGTEYRFGFVYHA